MQDAFINTFLTLSLIWCVLYLIRESRKTKAIDVLLVIIKDIRRYIDQNLHVDKEFLTHASDAMILNHILNNEKKKPFVFHSVYHISYYKIIGELIALDLNEIDYGVHKDVLTNLDSIIDSRLEWLDEHPQTSLSVLYAKGEPPFPRPKELSDLVKRLGITIEGKDIK